MAGSPIQKYQPVNQPLINGPMGRMASHLRYGWSGRTEQQFAPYGSTFLYTAANWGAVSWYLEAYFRSTSAKALCRLYDNTAQAPVNNSLITVDGASPTPSRNRSSSLTLTDGHEYQVQFGNQDQGAGAFLGAKLIAV